MMGGHHLRSHQSLYPLSRQPRIPPTRRSKRSKNHLRSLYPGVPSSPMTESHRSPLELSLRPQRPRYRSTEAQPSKRRLQNLYLLLEMLCSLMMGNLPARSLTQSRLSLVVLPMIESRLNLARQRRRSSSRRKRRRRVAYRFLIWMSP
ncbi:hypothetical protein B0T12DRAFT_425696 [Alternaria alternata]|nr:hypothetical protein B0T12DRAFT_425696 [Alternaria alternata]